jgi:4-amino-4-deoxychorismate lyase
MTKEYPLLESIRCNDGKFPLLHYHQQRVRKTYAKLWPDAEVPDLQRHLHNYPIPSKGLYKCRILYGISMQEPDYQPYILRPPKKLLLVVADHFDYSLKWSDRSNLDRLYDQKGDCDDVLIVKNGLITETTSCNIAFLRQGQWFTPSKPLLEGVRRMSLLDLKLIVTMDIPTEHINQFTHFKLFNAMIGWDDCTPCPVSAIIK